MGESREACEKATRLEKVPVEELKRLNKAAVKKQPTLADERSGDEVRNGKLGEDAEEKLIREEEGAVIQFGIVHVR